MLFSNRWQITQESVEKISILRSNPFQLLLDMDGSSKEEASRRLGANIIVDPSWVSSSSSSSASEGSSASRVGEDGCRRFSDLQEGLSAAKEGDVVYLEQGFYFREEVGHID